MGIHKEGYGIVLKTTAISAAVAVLCCIFLPISIGIAVSVLALILVVFVARFFRVPKRVRIEEDGTVFAPADGTVVVIEETDENEYLNERRIQVSVFMSIWNIHINWFPVGGVVEYFRHHHGKFMVAWHPKSSEENERTTTVVRTDAGEKILFRQIAGMVARRIVSYAKEGTPVGQNTQCGFIKFGSRVDVFLPLDAEVLVKLDEKVVGTQTVIARLKR